MRLLRRAVQLLVYQVVNGARVKRKTLDVCLACLVGYLASNEFSLLVLELFIYLVGDFDESAEAFDLVGVSI